MAPLKGNEKDTLNLPLVLKIQNAFGSIKVEVITTDIKSFECRAANDGKWLGSYSFLGQGTEHLAYPAGQLQLGGADVALRKVIPCLAMPQVGGCSVKRVWRMWHLRCRLGNWTT